MTRKQVAKMVKDIGLPYAYYQFPEGTNTKPPFICFFFTNSDDLFADDTNYQRIEVLNIELYSSDKDFDSEALIENALVDNHLTFYKEENFIDSEKMYQIAYEMEVLING